VSNATQDLSSGNGALGNRGDGKEDLIGESSEFVFTSISNQVAAHFMQAVHARAIGREQFFYSLRALQLISHSLE
jgi:hypothetical protein